MCCATTDKVNDEEENVNYKYGKIEIPVCYCPKLGRVFL